MENYQISSIYIYPIKSLAGVKLQKATTTPFGFKYDRRWMLIDEQNTFISQRTKHKMALFEVKISDNNIVVGYKDEQQLIPLEIKTGKKINVNIWKDTTEAILFNKPAINKWFSSILGCSCRLVFMPENSSRTMDTQYVPSKQQVSFADGYQYLLIGEQSLVLLNNKLTNPVTINRFRPNIVFAGGNAFDEDKFKHITINHCKFTIVKPCARCVLTTINPKTGIKGKEPLQTLSTFREKNGKILFGQNIINTKMGIIKVGDKLSLLA